jgi:hypothetical protein
MNGVPDPVPLIVSLIVLAALLACLRLARQGCWRLCLAQPLLAAGLAALLLSQPSEPSQPFGLITAGADPEQVSALRREQPSIDWLALPGAPALLGAQPIEDLGAVLRRLPAALVVIGDGLSPVELEQIAALPLRFLPSEPGSPEFVSLSPPPRFTAGQRWPLSGEVAPLAAGLAVHLLDPAGSSVAQSPLDTEGRFSLHGIAPLVVAQTWQLELRDGDRLLQRLPLPLSPAPARPLRALLLAATPSPEIKFLRRWALDAGIALDARIAAAPGLAMRRGNDALSGERLEELDLLLVDLRSWRQLGARQALLTEAVRAGLGLLILIDALPSAADLAGLAELGLALGATGDALTEIGPTEAAPRLAPGTQLQAWPLQREPDDALTQPLHALFGHAAWAPLGRGRVGASWLLGSFQYVQQGQPAAHATHWSQLVQQLARPAPVAPAWTPLSAPIAGQGLVLCGGVGGPRLVGPDGESLGTVADADSGCLAAWPARAGRWRLQQQGETPSAQWIDVLEADTLVSLTRAERRSATAAQAARKPWTDTTPVSTPRWQALALAGWLLLAALCWWSERRVLLAAGQGTSGR